VVKLGVATKLSMEKTKVDDVDNNLEFPLHVVSQSSLVSKLFALP